MSDTEQPFPKRELDSLLAALCDGRLDSSKHERLEEILISSPTARPYYHSYIDLHLELTDRTERELAVGHHTALRATNKILPFPTVKSLLGAMVATFAIALLILFWQQRKPIKITDASTPNPVATIKTSEHVVWIPESTSSDVGDILSTGSAYYIQSGSLALRFENGAAITLRGPVGFTIRNEMELFVSHGSVAADIPKSAHGFTILTPNAAFVDLGTKFSLNVSEDGDPTSDLYVREGLVIANLLGDNGTTISGVPAEAGKSVRVDSKGFSYGVTDSGSFLESLPIARNELSITPAYRNAVRASGPLAYWTFENSSGDSVPNEMGEKFAGQLSGGSTLTQAGGNTSLLINKNNIPSNFHIADPFENLNAGQGYSIEFCFNANTRKHASLVTLHSPRTAEQIASDYFGAEVPYLSQVELLGRNARAAGLICGDFTLRQVHRAPAGHTAGTDAITSTTYQAHQWYHLVAVATSDEVILYLDGEVVRRVSHKGTPDQSPYILSAGRLRPVGYPATYRQLDGSLDELAIYSRPLSQSEIRDHWKLAQPGSQKKK